MKSTLPIDALLPEIIQHLQHENNLVLQAPPGAGKSTRVPPALLDADLFPDHQPASILLLEPRRVAARATARRIAAERPDKANRTLGQEIGYQVRFDNRTSKNTRLSVITEGILTRRLQSDPFLEGINIVILDEFHERSLHTDLAVAFLKDLQQVRDDLKIIVMSATIATDEIAQFLDCKTLTSQGRTFPLEIEYLTQPPTQPIEIEAAHAVQRLATSSTNTQNPGNILVFLPGAGEIHRCEAALKPWARQSGFDVFPLYSALPPEQQDRALAPNSANTANQPKIILATNIAETSLTIEGVTTVIDSGFVRQMRMSPASGLDQLELTHISLASATQRAGRAARTQPGRALRLWTHAFEHRMHEFDAAEITRVDITAPILEVIAWSGKNPADFAWFEAPPTHAIERACTLLTQLGALQPVQSGEFRLTPLGRQILEIPAHPRIARMLLEAAQYNDPKITELTARVAAILSEPDFVTSTAHDAPTTDSDLLLRAEILPDAARGRTQSSRLHGLEIHPGRARRTFEAFQQLHRAIQSITTRQPTTPQNTPDTQEIILRAIAAAYPDRVCIAQDLSTNNTPQRRYTMTGGQPLILATESTVRDAPLLIATTIGGQISAHNTRNQELLGAVHNRALIRLASRLEPTWLDQLYPGRLTRKISVTFDDERERVMAHERELFDNLTLSESIVPLSQVADDALIAHLLAKKASESPEKSFAASDESRRFLHRLNALRNYFPELEIPDFFAYEEADTNPQNQSPSVLLQLCWGKRDFDALRRIDLASTLKSYLSHTQLQTLEEQIPERFTVPSGSQIRIDYQPDQPPVLAVRIQEIFGLTHTPAIANGRIPLTLHLLAPNYRPAQVTQDLPSFWKNTYPEIRKELRARYPRHPWPEDPTTAPAIRK